MIDASQSTSVLVLYLLGYVSIFEFHDSMLLHDSTASRLLSEGNHDRDPHWNPIVLFSLFCLNFLFLSFLLEGQLFNLGHHHHYFITIPLSYNLHKVL